MRAIQCRLKLSAALNQMKGNMTVEKMRIGLEIVLLAVCVILIVERQAQCQTIESLVDEVNSLTLENMHRVSPAKGAQ